MYVSLEVAPLRGLSMDFFCSIVHDLKRSHKEVYQDFQPSLTPFGGLVQIVV